VRVLIVGAHQDDILGLAGTILWLKYAGCEVTYVCTTLSQYEYVDEPLDPSEVATRLEKEMKECCKALGIDRYINLGYEDGFYTYSEKTIKEIVELIREIKPKIVFSRWIHESHPDHRAVGMVTRRASVLANYRYYRSGAEFADVAGVEGLYYWCGGNQPWLPEFKPNIFVGVSKYLKKIIESYLVFKTVKGIKKGLKRSLVIRLYNGIASGFRMAEAIVKDTSFSGWINDPLLCLAKSKGIPIKA